MTINTTTTTERDGMKNYWKEHSAGTNIETMMLDTNAKVLHEMERPEVLGKLPDLAQKDVLELAAGIGRYTSVLAETAKSLVSVEFIPEFHHANEQTNGHLKHVKFICEDVVKLELPSEQSKDVIFSNWLLMYLGDVEVKQFAMKCLKWLRPGGTLFFRESCFRQSGDVKRNSNPTHYRHPSFYIGAFGSAMAENEKTGDVSTFELVSSGSISTYRKMKQNNGQIYFLWRKVVKKGPIADVFSFQQFLDSQQYSNKSITRYEKIFGPGYVSTGGQATTTEFVSKLNLKPNERVLDVGCGIGGGNFYMAEKYGVSVVGIDLSTNMIHCALERSMSKPNVDVEFEICDATKKKYSPESFDVIYSRDTILHIEDKKSLFEKFYKWLKPGGRVLISDYCCGEQVGSDRFKKYVASRGYHLLSPSQYGKVLESAGFQNVIAEDRTEQFISVLKEELKRTYAQKEEFIQETSLEDFQAIVDGWESKLVRCADGDQKWGLIYALKP